MDMGEESGKEEVGSRNFGGHKKRRAFKGAAFLYEDGTNRLTFGEDRFVFS